MTALTRHQWPRMLARPFIPEGTHPSPTPTAPHLPGAPQPAGAAMYSPLHEVPQVVEHHEVQRDPHQSKEDAEEAGSHRVGAEVAIA